MTPNYKAIPGGRKARERAKLASPAAPEVPHLTRAQRRKAAREAGAEWCARWEPLPDLVKK